MPAATMPVCRPRVAALWPYLWAAPTTLLGLIVVAVTRPRLRVVDGVLEACGRRVAAAFDLLAPRRAIDAMTLGHVVLARCVDALEQTRAHERVHVAQCERWGPLFVPAYLAASAHAWWRGADAYVDNIFEREAFAAARTPGPRRDGEPVIPALESREQPRPFRA